MALRSVEELLEKYTSDELAAILCEELAAVGIPYSFAENEKFEYVPISASDIMSEIIYRPVERNDVIAKGYVSPVDQDTKRNEKMSYSNVANGGKLLRINENVVYIGQYGPDGSSAA